MLASHASAQEIEHARAILILIAVGIAVFWRAVLRVLLAALVIAVGAGAVLLLQSLHR
jgi:hypothetical protein